MIDPTATTRPYANHNDRFATNYTYYHPHGFWWGPVLAGAASAIAVQLLFTVLGLAIGITVADAGDSPDAGTMSVAAGAWWLITGTIALVIGGAVVGCLWGRHANKSLHLHSFAMWSIVAIFGFVVIWSGAGLASQAASPLATIATGYDIEPQQIMDRGGTAGRDGAATREGDLLGTDRAAEEADEAATAAAWWSLIGLVIGIVASLIGGVIGSKIADDDHTRDDHETHRDTTGTRDTRV